jgi:hypothetical protein
MRMPAVCSLIVCTIPLLILAPQAQPQTRAAESLNGEWHLTTVEMAIPYTERLQLTSAGENVAGQIYRSGKSVPVKGTVKSGEIHLEFQDGKETDTYHGKLTDAGMSGNYSVKGESETTTGTEPLQTNRHRPAPSISSQPTSIDNSPRIQSPSCASGRAILFIPRVSMRAARMKKARSASSAVIHLRGHSTLRARCRET